MSRKYEIIKNAIKNALEECSLPKCERMKIIGGHFDRFKYKLAKSLKDYFSLFDWIERIWYADIKGGDRNHSQRTWMSFQIRCIKNNVVQR